VQGAELLEAPASSGVRATPCIRFRDQARLHPLRYVVGLARAAERLGVEIRSGSRVMDLAGDGPVKATTRSGHIITAEAGVAATNVPSPINNWAGIYLKAAAYRTYVVGLEIAEDAIDDALYWDTLDPYHYVRLERQGGRTVLLVGGEDHKTGQAGTIRTPPSASIGLPIGLGRGSPEPARGSRSGRAKSSSPTTAWRSSGACPRASIRRALSSPATAGWASPTARSGRCWCVT
jgi:glycine/D-amino acid oxidase-like deaminating enzyme